MEPLRFGTICSGICTPSMALNNLNIQYTYEFASEILPKCKQFLLDNHNIKEFHDDAMKINVESLPDIDLFIGAFPCQPFSNMGKKGGLSDIRSSLMYKCIEIIQVKRPKYFILENVKSFKSNPAYKILIHQLNMIEGYTFYTEVLNTKNYGLPQNRERLFIIGKLDYNFKWILPSCIPTPPLDDFIIDKTIHPLPQMKKTLQNRYNEIKAEDKRGYVATACGFGSNMFNCCPTILASYRKYFHTKYNRDLSIQELKSLQGITVDLPYPKTTALHMIGNSISVNIMEVIFKILFSKK